MCTLSFVPSDHGYLVGMNRDEQLRRPRGLPPAAQSDAGGWAAIYPQEPGGGTWIACNRAGVTLGLLNWNRPVRPGPRSRTRGGVIPALIGRGQPASVARLLAGLALDEMHPFRLVGIFPAERGVREWRWNGERIACLKWTWERLHWFSSSLSDAAAGRIRAAACRPGPSALAGGVPGWMWRLHRSHRPERGPFSFCVHRSDAATVSYTEIEFGSGGLCMRYLDGAPCLKNGFDAVVGLSGQAVPVPAPGPTSRPVHC